MDNSNPVVPGPTPAPQPTPQQPAIPQVPLPTQTGDSNKMILWFVLGVVIIAVLVGGIYFLLSKRQEKVSSQVTQQEEPVVQATPKVEDMVSALDKDLSDVNVETALETDFNTIDQDLQGL